MVKIKVHDDVPIYGGKVFEVEIINGAYGTVGIKPYLFFSFKEADMINCSKCKYGETPMGNEWCKNCEADGFIGWELREEVDKSCETCGHTKPCNRCRNFEDYPHWVEYKISKSDCIAGMGTNAPTITEESPTITAFRQIMDDKIKLAIAKNSDYGNSFDKILDTWTDNGNDPYLSMYIRLADKFNRFENLVMGNKQQVKDESIMDTLADLSNYVDLFRGWKMRRDSNGHS